MIDPKVFVKAAKLVATADVDFACDAISKVSKPNRALFNINYFSNIYEPKINNSNSLAWLTETDESNHEVEETKSETPTGKTRRVLALLFAAEIARDGGIE